ncbi:MAG: OmpH family outer membrane protein [Desulfobulbaceae bacterium]|nr:OmpH family outer membrane protein [Desulfobulbaceae bacterium]
MNGFKYIMSGLCAVAVFSFSSFIGSAQAAELKIGVVNMQKVLTTSSAGKKAQSIIEQKMKSYDSTFKKDKDSLVTMRDEIEKKSSAWSDTVKQQKFSDFQKKSAELGTKEREANQEIRKLQERHVQPVLEKLEEVIQKVAKGGQYDLILPSNTILYASGKHDITDQVTKALDAAMK